MQLQHALGQVYDKVHGWIQTLVLHLPNLIVALILLFVFWAVGKGLKKLTHQLTRRTAVAKQITELTAAMVYVALLIVGVVIALGTVGLDKTVTSLLAGAGIVGIAVGLAFQATGENIFAGLYLSIRRPFSVGQVIKSKDYFGTVEKVALRATWLRVPEGQLVFLPNKNVLENPIINYSEPGRRRVDIGVRVSFAEDLEKAREIALEAIGAMENRRRDDPVQLFYDEFDKSSINFEIRFWIDFGQQAQYRAARSEAVIRVKKAFDANGIAIPFPIRTLDFAPVGGETLVETAKSIGFGRSE